MSTPSLPSCGGPSSPGGSPSTSLPPPVGGSARGADSVGLPGRHLLRQVHLVELVSERGMHYVAAVSPPLTSWQEAYGLHVLVSVAASAWRLHDRS